MKNIVVFIVGLAFCMASVSVDAQRTHRWNRYDTTGYFKKEVFMRDGDTLTFVNLDSTFDHSVEKRLIETFFKVYPEEVQYFNPNSTAQVTFIIDPQYKGVAATSRSTVRYNPDWFRGHPEDIDVVTHEAMHIVQSYHFGNVPGWLTEGIADYVRYVYGVNNKAAGWTLPDFNEKQSYENAYRVTARFLLWIEQNKKQGIVKQLDAALRAGAYSTDLWEKSTGSTLDQLWEEYGKNPELKLQYR